jgi:dynactin complex subunit
MVANMKSLKEKDKTFDKINKDDNYYSFQTEKRNTLNSIYKDLLEE